ncbi:MAG: NAD(P)-binding protein [Pirellulaceae bacterium]|nr:NAD(P)-binding protein [Pirellulaceae bacterium]
MPLRLTNLELPVAAPEESLRGQIASRLGIGPAEPLSWRILRKSLDARSRDSLRFVFTVAVTWPGESDWLATGTRHAGIERFEPAVFDEPPAGVAPLAERPVVVGSGPGGLLAAYYLAVRGYRPLVLERGDPVKERVPAIRAFDRGGPLDTENNYLFGEGGAGTFSDGKLTCRLSGPDVDWVLEQFVACGGKPEIRYEQRPHLGSNRLPMLVRNFRRKIEALGGEYRFRCRMEALDIADGRVRGVSTSSGHLPASVVILAIGHSARDTYAMLHRAGVPLARKAFQLGLRIEQPQAQVNRHKYGEHGEDYERILGAADYSLITRGQRDLFTFCMCAGGVVIPSVSEPGMFCTNGMSNSRHDTPFANSGVMVTLEPHEFSSEHPLAGVEIQRQFEAAAFKLSRGAYLAPIQRAADFLVGKTPASEERLESSYPRGVVPANLHAVLPPVVLAALKSGLPLMDRQWRGDFLRDATLVGPEMRGSSPVRIARDHHTRETPNIAGLFPVGEGAGYAGGIISAAVDGLRTAKQIVAQFAPLG